MSTDTRVKQQKNKFIVFLNTLRDHSRCVYVAATEASINFKNELERYDSGIKQANREIKDKTYGDNGIIKLPNWISEIHRHRVRDVIDGYTTTTRCPPPAENNEAPSPFWRNFLPLSRRFVVQREPRKGVNTVKF